MIGLFFFLLLANSWALETEFRWLPDKHDPFDGSCFEIDTATLGNKFRNSVSKEKCRPKRTVFYWVERKYSGRCYEVDEETNGKQFVFRTKPKFCRPDKTTYLLIDKKCFEVDSETNGERFKLGTKDEHCKEKLKTYFAWKPSGQSVRGRCYEVDSETDGTLFMKGVSNEKCRPKEIEYLFVKDSSYGGGTCYEVDKINGPSHYASGVDVKYCRDQEKWTYQWQGEGERGGCYRLGSDKEGKVISKRASKENCRPENISYVWKPSSKLSGKCVALDSETYGKKYYEVVKDKNCRPERIKRIWAESGGYGQEGLKSCYIVDDETGGSLFSKKVSKDQCKLKETKIYFKIGKFGKEGSCIEVGSSGPVATDKDKCRPEKTKYVWEKENNHSGECYEVDEYHGHKGWSDRVNKDKCRPAKTKFLFINGKNGGRCYLVDEDTGGSLYSENTKIENCKETL